MFSWYSPGNFLNQLQILLISALKQQAPQKIKKEKKGKKNPCTQMVTIIWARK